MSTATLAPLLLALSLAACTTETATPGITAQPPAAAAPSSPVPLQSQLLPPMVVHKTPSCGCCTVWVEHIREAGFTVEEVIADDLGPIKQGLGVPYAKGSCHTAEVGGYLVEGHVPAEDIKRLLAERPDARGLVLPGMPLGSPGMETPDGRVQPYIVELVRRDGSVEPFARHGN